MPGSTGAKWAHAQLLVESAFAGSLAWTRSTKPAMSQYDQNENLQKERREISVCHPKRKGKLSARNRQRDLGLTQEGLPKIKKRPLYKTYNVEQHNRAQDRVLGYL
jgi:hypothetical protein